MQREVTTGQWVVTEDTGLISVLADWWMSSTAYCGRTDQYAPRSLAWSVRFAISFSFVAVRASYMPDYFLERTLCDSPTNVHYTRNDSSWLRCFYGCSLTSRQLHNNSSNHTSSPLQCRMPERLNAVQWNTHRPTGEWQLWFVIGVLARLRACEFKLKL